MRDIIYIFETICGENRNIIGGNNFVIVAWDQGVLKFKIFEALVSDKLKMVLL